MNLYLVLFIAIPLQFFAAFLALRLVRITKRGAWALIAIAILLMALRRCFTLYEWYIREMVLMPIDIGTEIVGLATSVLMVIGLSLIAPLFIDIKRSKEILSLRVEERTGQLKDTVKALELELSERQQAEEALRRSEVRFRTIADFTYDWEYWLAPDGSYYYNSPSCERITGYLAKDFLKDSGLLEKITHPEDRPKIFKHLHAELEDSEAHSLDFRIITKDGEERWIAHVCQPVYSPTGRNLGRRASNREVTQQKKAEEEKTKLGSQLRQAQKIEAIGRLAGGIAHDFNNILSPIIMYTEIALRTTASDNPIRSYLEQVLKSSFRASDLVKQILAISRQTEPQRIILQLSPLVKDALKLLRSSFPATIEMRHHLSADSDWILADPTEIYQVVMNLCTNAAQAIQEKGGVIEVNLDPVDLAQEQMGYTMKVKPGSYVRLSVHDNGQGMTPEVIERIFEPYFTTKEIGQGTGLGLAMVHSIIQTCEGAINVFSQPGEGTTFQVYFPLAPTAEVQEPEGPLPMPTGKERILMVDDEADIVAAVKIMLDQVGYEVVGFTNGQEALTAFQSAPETFDMVIADQTMPRMMGVELAQEILQVRADIPVILCSGYGVAITPEKAKALGFRELIMKPFIPQQLAATIRRVLDSGKHEE